MNFVLLFGTIYIASYFGSNKLISYLYVPYLLGILGSKLFMKYLYKIFSSIDQALIHIFGLILSLLFLLFPSIFPIGIFLSSLFISGTSSYLNQVYIQKEQLPQNQRIIIKYSTQVKGSLLHQFLMMLGFLVMSKTTGISVDAVLQITAYKQSNTQLLKIVDVIHYLSMGVLLYLLFLILYERLSKDRKIPFVK